MQLLVQPGRKQPITKEMWQYAGNTLASLLDKEDRPIQLVSGGAGGLDHLAVRFFLKTHRVDTLHLCLPDKFDFRHCQFMDTCEVNWKTNPGGTSNFYHKKFSKIIYGDEYASLMDLRAALQNEFVSVEYGDGLFDRNGLVAKAADKCIAFTFGKGSTPDDGGTANTFNQFVKMGKPVLHVSLANIN